MGASFSDGNNLYVHVDKPFYVPGEMVNGQVLLNCVQPIKCQSLILRVHGYEQTKRRAQEVGRADNRHITHTRHFFGVRFPLQQYDHPLQPGRYAFPFGFVLPPDLPGSFDFQSHNMGQHISAKVRYKVRAHMHVEGVMKPDLRAKRHLNVHQPPRQQARQVIKEARERVEGCFGSKGEVHIIAQYDKDIFCPGEITMIQLQVENLSKVGFGAVHVKLIHHVRLMGRDGYVHHQARECIREKLFQGVQRGAKLMGDQCRYLEFHLPPYLLGSSWGKLVHSDFTLDIKLKASGSCDTDTGMAMPIMMTLAPQVDYQMFTAYPSYWAPQAISPRVDVDLPPAPNDQPQPIYAGYSV